MNNEPIQFMPVNRFWETRPAKLNVGAYLMLGFTAGIVVATLVFSACAYLVK